MSKTLNLLSLLALGFVFTASECHNEISFDSPPNREICDDHIDNDSDGFVDCRDSECAAQCVVTVTINPISTPVLYDSLKLSGTCNRAVSVAVSLSPVTAGQGGQAQVSGSAWSLTLRSLVNGPVSLSAVAVDSTGLFRDSAATGFTVNHP